MDFSGMRGSIPKVGEPPKKVCALCKAPADKSCGACHEIDYCSAEHQKSHWKEHKKDCPPIRIITSPELGHHFVATRDLTPGTLIHTELPILVNPFLTHKAAAFISCISCRSIISDDPWPCFQCSTPFFCNLACSMNKIHTDFECGVLSKCNHVQKANIICISNKLGFLRAMGLKNKDPKTWAKVLKLRGAGQYKPGDADESDKFFIREILPLLGEKGVGFEAEMTKLKGILQLGITDYPSHPLKKDYGESQFLYLEGSNFAQNCFPNCSRIICKDPQFQLQVRTTVGVKKGSITSIDFQRVSNEYGAMFQKHKMHLIGGALCTCPRCTDTTGTELGTMLSAVKCMTPNCKYGYLLPVDPRDMAENAPWRCNRSECKGKGSTWGEMNEIIKGLESDMIVFLASVHLEDLEDSKEFLVSLKKKLHPNHWLILKFLRNMIGKENSVMEKGLLGRELSVPGIQLYFSMTRDMLEIFELTAPGLSLPKAHIWQNILAIIMAKWTNLVIRGSLYPEGWEDEFKRRANEAIDKFCSIAKFYPDLWTKELIEDSKKLKLRISLLSGLGE